MEQATTQGMRESRMQGEGLQIRDAETDAETVNNRLMINVAEEMKHLHELAERDSGKRFVKLWNKLISAEWLAQAGEQIRRNKGRGTPGIDKMTDEAIGLELIEKLAERLKQGAYRPKPVRRVYIPKTNGKVRPLGIPTLEDRIIQQAPMRIKYKMKNGCALTHLPPEQAKSADFFKPSVSLDLPKT